MTDMKKSATLLYVEDDESLRFVTQDNLSLAGYEVIPCADGSAALQAFREHPVDLCIIDVMLPKVDGFAVARHIRETNERVPILFLSAKSMKEDRITGLRIGADDYMVKPFSIEELLLKVEIFLRRSQPPGPIHSKSSQPQVMGDYLFNQKQQQLQYRDELRDLTNREAELLGFLATRKNQVVRREDILAAIWGEDDYFAGRSLDVFISRLRKYLQKDPRILIENIHGVGFRLIVAD